MIFKSFEINKINFNKNNFYLLYGENEGLKKDIKETITTTLKKKIRGYVFNDSPESEVDSSDSEVDVNDFLNDSSDESEDDNEDGVDVEKH